MPGPFNSEEAFRNYARNVFGEFGDVPDLPPFVWHILTTLEVSEACLANLFLGWPHVFNDLSPHGVLKTMCHALTICRRADLYAEWTRFYPEEAAQASLPVALLRTTSVLYDLEDGDFQLLEDRSFVPKNHVGPHQEPKCREANTDMIAHYGSPYGGVIKGLCVCQLHGLCPVDFKMEEGPEDWDQAPFAGSFVELGSLVRVPDPPPEGADKWTRSTYLESAWTIDDYGDGVTPAMFEGLAVDPAVKEWTRGWPAE